MGGPDVKGGQGHAAFLEAMAGAWLGRSAQGSEAPRLGTQSTTLVHFAGTVLSEPPF